MGQSYYEISLLSDCCWVDHTFHIKSKRVFKLDFSTPGQLEILLIT